jgi:hypothetical protein
MSNLKNVLRILLGKLGYEIHRSSEQFVSYGNFCNLTLAYEARINEVSDLKISKNDLRPKLLARLLGTPPSEAYFIVHALAKCQNVAGEVCEFGVAQGETSTLIANEIQSSNKVLHLFDSFEGLPKPTEKDHLKDDIFSLGSMDAYTGKMSCPEDMVLTRLKAISFRQNRFVVHKGFIERILNDDLSLPKKVSFAFVDFDFYEPIKVTLEFLHLVTEEGAMIIVDDYDYFSSGAKTAVDEFIEDKNLNQEIYQLLIPDTQYGHFAVLSRNG